MIPDSEKRLAKAVDELEALVVRTELLAIVAPGLCQAHAGCPIQQDSSAEELDGTDEHAAAQKAVAAVREAGAVAV